MKNFSTKDEVWSLIPARGGSKKVKKKNLQKILNYSLVAYAVKASKKSKFISRTFVSTDSKKIKQEGLKFGAEVPFLRSKKNSGDLSTNYDVVLEFLNKILQIDKQYHHFYQIIVLHFFYPFCYLYHSYTHLYCILYII